MRNITVAIDDQTYRNVRLWCATRDVSISHVVQTFLNDLPRLENVHRFPTPGAPDSNSLGALFDRLDPAHLNIAHLNMLIGRIGI